MSAGAGTSGDCGMRKELAHPVGDLALSAARAGQERGSGARTTTTTHDSCANRVLIAAGSADGTVLPPLAYLLQRIFGPCPDTSRWPAVQERAASSAERVYMAVHLQRAAAGDAFGGLTSSASAQSAALEPLPCHSFCGHGAPLSATSAPPPAAAHSVVAAPLLIQRPPLSPLPTSHHE